MKFNSKFTLGAIGLQIVGCVISVFGYVVDDMLAGERENEAREMTRRLVYEELNRERQNGFKN